MVGYVLCVVGCLCVGCVLFVVCRYLFAVFFVVGWCSLRIVRCLVAVVRGLMVFVVSVSYSSFVV